MADTPATWKEYRIRAYAPLLFRDSRPFDAFNSAETLPFPFPSTVAGAFRNAVGEANGYDKQAYKTSKDTLLNIAIQGPLLCTEDEHGNTTLLFPKPQNAVYLANAVHKNGADGKDTKSDMQLLRVQPGAVAKDEYVDLPEGLQPVFLAADAKGKPGKGPAFWGAAELLRWLKMDNTLTFKDVQEQGLSALPLAPRTHVKLAPASRTAESGYLFQTVGLDLGPRPERQGTITQERETESSTPAREEKEPPRPELQFSLRAQPISGQSIPGQAIPGNTFGSLGGERRLVYWQADSSPCWPECDSGGLQGANSFCLCLATPALFKYGWIPDGLNAATLSGEICGIAVQLRAVALDRWQAWSGWDLESDRSRVLQRTVPAGAVYWFEVTQKEGLSEKNVQDLWFASIVDDPQQRKNGFGMVLPGRAI